MRIQKKKKKLLLIHTDPWRVSTKTPDPDEAKFTPYVNTLSWSCKYGGRNGKFAYSAGSKSK